MAKVRDPITLASYFGIDVQLLDNKGILNPTLGFDTLLFIDPLLLEESQHSEISKCGRLQYEKHFQDVIKLLKVSRSVGDVPWRNAYRLFQFHEICGTCLGYGAGSIKGSAFGEKLIGLVMRTGKTIVDLGVSDPDLFCLLALFESGIGPDRISDMTTNVILDSLIKFNIRVMKELCIEGEVFSINGKKVTLLKNPLQKKDTPIILLPSDVLRPLPIAMDWDGVCAAASHNNDLRNRVNKHISHIWAVKARRDKALLKIQVLADANAFQVLLDVIKKIPKDAYDPIKDPEGLLRWAQTAKDFAEKYPLIIEPPTTIDLNSVFNIVKIIIKQFRQLVEDNGLSKSLWHNGNPLREKHAQRLFFAVAYSYCKNNNIDVSPEVDSGNGQVDFKFSKGFNSRVLVEIKLSDNSNLLSGYHKQLEAYKESEDTMKAFYLIIDVGRMGEKAKKLNNIQKKFSDKGYLLSELEFINGKIKPSASKR